MSSWVRNGVVRLFLKGAWVRAFLRVVKRPQEPYVWSLRVGVFIAVEQERDASGKGTKNVEEALREVKRLADEKWKQMGQE